jgi:hypothetical protein
LWDLGDTSSGLASAFKFEYFFRRKNLERVMADTANTSEDSKYDFKNAFLFEPNKTFNIFAAQAHRRIAMAEGDCPATELRPIISDTRLEEDRLLKNENAIGEIIARNDAVVSYTEVGKLRCDDIAHVARIGAWLNGLGTAR